MTLDQIFRRITGKPAQPKSLSELDDDARAFINERSRGLEGWTSAELDDVTQRTLETPEGERAMREGDEAIRLHRGSRPRE